MGVVGPSTLVKGQKVLPELPLETARQLESRYEIKEFMSGIHYLSNTLVIAVLT